jgi:pimeloyl-ACP methyl ester carboxylesterase
MIRVHLLLVWAISGVAVGGLTKDEASTAVAELSQKRVAALKAERAAEIEDKSITIGDKTMKWLEKTYGDAAEGKRSLWISMHGGGQTASAVNDQQWQNQLTLYQPKEGIYVAPRAPTDTWNLWHQDHIDPLLVRLIEGMIATRGVDPDKVYLMGYSAGGDGAWQLAPRMADRFAAVSMMAGHPGDANLEGVRNVAFGIFCGGDDAAYERNKRTKEGGEKLAELQKNDPGGYPHMCRVYPDLGHWMNHKDAEAVPWMEGFQRRTWPKKVVWVQDDVTHSRFYWISLPEQAFPPGSKLVATVEGQTISLEGSVPPGTSLWLSDELVNLDQPVTLKVNGKVAYNGQVERTKEAISEALVERLDLNSCPTARLRIP